MTEGMRMLDAEGARHAKSEGQQLTLEFSGDWIDAITDDLLAWMRERRAAGVTTMTMEQFRSSATRQPKSHKSWGALTTAMRKAGHLHPLGYVASTSVKTHAHPVMLWEMRP